MGFCALRGDPLLCAVRLRRIERMLLRQKKTSQRQPDVQFESVGSDREVQSGDRLGFGEPVVERLAVDAQVCRGGGDVAGVVEIGLGCLHQIGVSMVE